MLEFLPNFTLFTTSRGDSCDEYIDTMAMKVTTIAGMKNKPFHPIPRAIRLAQNIEAATLPN
ncbi:MAG: hypothetical protein KA715_00410 [Xanthomonadaceae bacterium]|nr:hypothetical protein [Xanthomonadaceae bacterium]